MEFTPISSSKSKAIFVSALNETDVSNNNNTTTTIKTICGHPITKGNIAIFIIIDLKDKCNKKSSETSF